VLFAIHRDGTVAGRVTVDANFHDWEDIATDEQGRLYLADTGNNSRERNRVNVYRIAEPETSAKHAEILDTWKLAFPDKPFNCESLFIWRDFGYVISKNEDGERAAVYRFPLQHQRKSMMLEKVMTLPIDQPVTAADISRDGKRLAVLSRGALYLFEIDGTVEKAGDATPQRISIPPIQAEGCCFVPDGVLMVAETGEVLLAKLEPPATTQSATRATASCPDEKSGPPSLPASAPTPGAAQSAPPAPTR
jgi:hypothetical protein